MIIGIVQPLVTRIRKEYAMGLSSHGIDSHRGNSSL